MKSFKKSYAGNVVLNMGWMVFDKVFILFLNLLVTVKIANHFGADTYGQYQYAVNIVALFEVLVTFVDARIVKKQYVKEDPSIVVASATACRLLFSIISAVLGTVYLLFIDIEGNMVIMYVILFANSIIMNLRFGMANRFEYLLKSKKIVIAADIAAIIGTYFQVITVQMNLSIIAISVISLMTTSINLIVLFIQYKVEFRESMRFILDKSIIKRMIKESIPLAIASSCAVIYSRCDSVILGSMMTKVEVGIYSISVKLINIVQIAIAPIRESVFPRLIHLYDTDIKAYEKRYVQITSMLNWIYIVGVLVSFAILPMAFNVLNKEYIQALPVFRIHVVGTFFMYNAALRAGHFTLTNKGKILSWSQLISVIVNVLMNYIGISYLGIYGAAIATIVTQCVSLMLSNLFFTEGRRVLKWQLKALNPLYIIKR